MLIQLSLLVTTVQAQSYISYCFQVMELLQYSNALNTGMLSVKCHADRVSHLLLNKLIASYSVRTHKYMILISPYFIVPLAHHCQSLSAFQYLKYWITLLANNLTCTTIIANIHKTFLIKKHATKLLGCASSMLPTRTKIHFDPNFTKDKKGGSFTAFWTDSMGQSTTYMETFNYTFF